MAKGLGKGLSALMQDDYSATAKESATGAITPTGLPISSIVSGTFQPRTKFTQEYLDELAQSIKKNGVMQPILVRQKQDSGNYEIIAGERRWRAAKIAGLKEIPAIVKEITDQEALELAIIENIQRQDLSPLEEAAGYQRLIEEFNYTQEALATTVGKSRSHVANLIRLLSLPEKIRRYLEEDKLTMGHARALLGAENAEALADEVIRRDLNVRQTENLAKGGTGEMPEKAQRKPSPPSSSRHQSYSSNKDPEIIALEENLSESLGMKVGINDRGQQGEIVITYESLMQLDKILQRLSAA